MSASVSLLGGDAVAAAPTAISFSQIPANARVPLFHVEFDNSQTSQNQVQSRTLLIGIAGNAVPSVPTYVPSAASASGTFAATSPLTAMIAAYLANDPNAELYALPVFAPEDAVAATGTIAFTGTATSAATVGIYVAGLRFQVSISIGDTAANVVSNALTAIASQANSAVMPGYFSGASGTLTFNCYTTGAHGNAIDLRLNYGGAAAGESLPFGITVAVTPMASGTLIPDLSGLAAILGDANWDFIVNPFSDSTSLGSMTALMGFSAGRWSDASQAFGHVWGFRGDTSANLLTFGAGLNDPHQTIPGLYNAPSPPWVWAAAIAGANAQALKADPSRTTQTLTVNGVLAPAEADCFSNATRQALLSTGVATLVRQRDGSMQIERMATTYQTNAWGQPDQSYLDTETLYALMFLTRDLKSFVTQTFPRCKLAADGTRAGAGSSVVTPKAIKAAMVSRYSQLEAAGQAQNTAAFSAGLVVQLNGTDPNRVDVLYDPILMGNLRIFAALNQFRLAA